jgi:hypothetical protein
MMRRWRLVVLIALLSTGAYAQWLNFKTPGTPRTPDGKPNLNAAPPRTADGKPDFSGIWQADSFRWNENLAPEGTDAPMLPAAAQLYKHRVDTLLGWDRPMTYCMPDGVPDAMTVPGLRFKTLQMPAVTVLLFQEFHLNAGFSPRLHDNERIRPWRL